MKLNVLSYNMHKGVGFFSRKPVLDKIKKSVRETGADLVFLQEIRGQTPGQESPQFEFLADSIWKHYEYGKNAIFQSSHHGNAILSRFPFIQSENINISTNRFERRGILHGVVQDPESGTRVHVIALHLNLLESGRRPQVKKLEERILEKIPEDEPVIVAGDFNDWRELVTPALSSLGFVESFLSLSGRHPRTFPAFFPVLPLDRIYVRGLNVQRAEVLRGPSWLGLSDHLPLLAEFTVNVVERSRIG